MRTVDTISSDTIEIKGSKFIAFLMPMALYSSQMEQLRLLHPKAVHFVSAYRYLNEFDQIVEYAGDDGEPKGTSGKPTLAVLQGHELINTAVITVRYFGGTKLGPGGLVRAYAEAANAAVARADQRIYEKPLRARFSCSYPDVSMIEYGLSQNGVRTVDKTFGEKGAEFVVEGSEEKLAKLFEQLGRAVTRSI